jgi:hypothetical protein
MPLISTIGGCSGRNYGARLKPKLRATVSISDQTVATGYEYTFTPIVLDGGCGFFVYSISPSLPSGMSLNTSTGTVSGTPTDLQSTTTYTITGVDRCGEVTQASFTLTVAAGIITSVEMLLVAGGGGGAYGDNNDNGGGGGGAGGVFYSTDVAITADVTYDVSVGAGGGSSINRASNGNDTYLYYNGSYIKLTKGGGGGSIGEPAGSGGSGGGASRTGNSGGSALQPSYGAGNYGSPGANGFGSISFGGSGGGGAANPGTNAGGGGGGNGGNGTDVASDLLEAAGRGVYYAPSGTYFIAAGGGGGAAGTGNPGGGGGAGGGGSGGTQDGTGTSGLTRTGSGGGGGGRGGGEPGFAGGAGGSGIAIFRIPSAYPAATTSGADDIRVVGSNRIYTFFQGAGTIKFNSNPPP